MVRPSKYSEELVNEICEKIAGGESVRSICSREDMPERETIRLWLKDKPEFLGQYARAKEEGAETFEDDIIDAIKNVNANNAQAVKVKTDTLFKLMALRNPKKYNSKVDLTSSDGTMSPDKNIRVTFVTAKSQVSEKSDNTE